MTKKSKIQLSEHKVHIRFLISFNLQFETFLYNWFAENNVSCWTMPFNYSKKSPDRHLILPKNVFFLFLSILIQTMLRLKSRIHFHTWQKSLIIQRLIKPWNQTLFMLRNNIPIKDCFYRCTFHNDHIEINLSTHVAKWILCPSYTFLWKRFKSNISEIGTRDDQKSNEFQ